MLLLSCYELGRQPLGIALPAAFFERAGYEPAVTDLQVDRLDPRRIARARLAAISVPMHTALRLGMEAGGEIRRLNPSCHIVFHGLYALLNAEHLLAGPADSVLGGECEEDLVALADSLDRHGVAEPPPTRAALRRLDFPAPRRAGLPPLARYARLEHGGRTLLAAAVEASRGCLHGCLHCPVPPVYGGRFFAVPRHLVLEDVRRLVAAGAHHVTFADADFLNGPGHALRLVREMNEEFPALTFDFTARVGHLLRHRALLPEMRDRGCLFVVSALESLSDRVLAELEKGHTRDQVFELVETMREAGITLRPSFVPFTPWACLDDYLEILEFAAVADLVDQVDAVQYSIRLLVPPGSALLSRPGIRPFLGPLRPERLSYDWSHPDPRMDRLQGEVARLAEEAAGSGEAPRATWARIHRLALETAPPAPHGRPVALPPPPAFLPPRLTESWFC